MNETKHLHQPLEKFSLIIIKFQEISKNPQNSDYFL